MTVTDPVYRDVKAAFGVVAEQFCQIIHARQHAAWGRGDVYADRSVEDSIAALMSDPLAREVFAAAWREHSAPFADDAPKAGAA